MHTSLEDSQKVTQKTEQFAKKNVTLSSMPKCQIKTSSSQKITLYLIPTKPIHSCIEVLCL